MYEMKGKKDIKSVYMEAKQLTTAIMSVLSINEITDSSQTSTCVCLFA